MFGGCFLLEPGAIGTCRALEIGMLQRESVLAEVVSLVGFVAKSSVHAPCGACLILGHIKGKV